MDTNHRNADTSRRIEAVRCLAFGLVCCAALTCQAEAPFSFATTPGQLPKGVVPSAYRLELAPDLEQLTFSGREEIDIDVARATAVITVNAIDLSFSRVALGGDDQAVAQVALDAKKQTATFHFAHVLGAGQHTLAITYSGRIPATPAGIYYDDYATAAGKRRMLVTQFESIDARRMFPGWDEPVFKATFQLTVELPSDLAVISNTPVASTQAAGKSASGAALTKTIFAITPRMSSYLLVLCAGHLERIHDTSSGTDIGVWTVEGKAEQGREGLQAAVKLLKYYNHYFAVAYPLPKLDLIAVPGNYAAGAMENWGGITFIDNVLLMDPASSSESTRQAIFAVVAHEMAHQWSGDLVTMAWWNDVWLNEGFASWMGSKATDALNPEWHIWLREHASKERAMGLDARSTTHPIQMQITDDSEIESAFDAISYSKGEAFLRMIEVYLGEDAFRDGMRRYMSAHKYSNATTADLWAQLDAASGKPVTQIAARFTEQPGIPLIDVAVACHSGQSVATLHEERFTINDPTAAKLTWNVPVQIGVGADAKGPRTVLVGTTPATLSFAGCGAPVKANFGDAGYYRVQYDAGALQKLASALPKLAPADRVDLLADQWALFVAGRAELASYLDLTSKLATETTLVVWSDVLAKLDAIDALVRQTPEQTTFRRYALQLLRPALARTGWDATSGENNQTALLRAALIRALGQYGDPAVIAECRRRFAAFLTQPASLAPNLRSPVINTVGRYADQATFHQLRALGKASSGTEDKLRYYYALANAQNASFIDQNIKIALTDELPNGRVNRFLLQVAIESNDPDLVWKTFLAQRAPILAKLPAGRGAALLAAIAQESTNPAVARELLALPEAQASKGDRYQAAKAIERIQEQSALKKRLLPPLTEWLHGH